MRKIRLFLEESALKAGQQLKIAENNFDYLTKVMRQKIGDRIFVFNGRDGEFAAEIISIEKKFLLAEIKEKISELKKSPNITLAFAMVKNVGLDFIATKAVELGVSRFQPIITNRTIVDKINNQRFKIYIKEACEQCERNDFAEISEIKKLDKFLAEAEISKKVLILCDESGQAGKASAVLSKISAAEKEIVILVGPEGGFTNEEFDKMRALKNLYPISLGPRILRADTAMVAALSLVQEFLGDW